ncbi:2-amino-4-hydroxy-6-hydroxymethyldihydropteridine diphosphokinase [Bifidobacterium imperatoris]|uniref:Bifunctional folate synthesis protein n=1 Tax=Bifidobacterium imperatoris TaxID=2020965 RepID=A0A2N5IQZ6_9BIFI|nr:2-amino-4-hydroxy-6-hydroxymethyldihydropteridine diphosphokinase [Bifidobacterium imperatoris]PLS24382.1 2-amino-4-hydroxy-6- hydroxymethyldihydropteridin e pyrophosphokinase [Bifidobacterium imperatoris]QSY56921.1 2-amino-4-hydroxy-6-hydroxymethyldihydropteridine diphosphokinase [Bifidobacterium imperatoris]
MDTITLTGVSANGTHGVLDFEHQRAQPFIVDATLYLDLFVAGQSDALNDTVDYGRVAKDIVAVIEGEHVDLIEKLAQRIAERILAIKPIVKVDLTIHKPHAPITVPFVDVAVSITRVRNAQGAVVPEHMLQSAVSSTTQSPVSSAGQPAVHHAVVAMGGNIGDVESTLRAAVREMDGLPGTQVGGISPLYRTAAWGMADDTPDFLNAVVELETTMSSHELLDALQNIERVHGRNRENHWDSRPLDLDIIDFDGITSADPDLSLPHPRAWQRAFVLVPWLALNPTARLTGAHGGLVSDLLAAAADRDAVQLDSEDWMLAGHAGGSDSAQHPQADHDAVPVSRKAVISLDSTSREAEQLFREAIVSIDSVPGNQVQGISPLYHVSHFDGPDALSAVIQVETKLPAADLIAVLGGIEAAHEGLVDIDLVDMDGVTSNTPDCRVPWPSAREHASVLAPWMDMDPDAKLGSDPVSFLLAMAPDAGQVGMLSDNWIMGE